jgi:hypothetical protein
MQARGMNPSGCVNFSKPYSYNENAHQANKAMKRNQGPGQGVAAGMTGVVLDETLTVLLEVTGTVLLEVVGAGVVVTGGELVDDETTAPPVKARATPSKTAWSPTGAVPLILILNLILMDPVSTRVIPQTPGVAVPEAAMKFVAAVQI